MHILFIYYPFVGDHVTAQAWANWLAHLLQYTSLQHNTETTFLLTFQTKILVISYKSLL